MNAKTKATATILESVTKLKVSCLQDLFLRRWLPRCLVLVCVYLGGATLSAQQLFNQSTDYSATSTGSWYSDNWYQLGTGFSGPLQTLTVKCYTSGPAPYGTGSVTLNEFSDPAYSTLTNSYSLGQRCTHTPATVTFSNLNITLLPSRYYRLDTYDWLQNAYVVLQGTSTMGLAMYDVFLYGTGIVRYYYTFYPYIVSSSVAPSTYGSPSSVNPAGVASEPINTATGNYYTSHADILVPGKGLSLDFTRYYNSLDPSLGPLGFGWTHSFNISLNADIATGIVTVREADGHAVSFSPESVGMYTAITPGLFDSLIGNADGSFTLTRKNQTKLHFSPTGKLTSIVDRNGNTQTLNYDASGNLMSVIDSAGRTFEFFSDSAGRLTNVFDPIGRCWQYFYDANSNLVSLRDPVGGMRQFTYDANHKMLSANDQRGITFLHNTYDSVGRVITQTNGRGFTTTLAYNSPAPGVTTFTDPLGNATQHVYDSSLRLIGIKDANGGNISYAYDANNDRTQIIDQNGNTVKLAYDSQGNATSIIDPLGNTQAFTYDMQNDVLTSTNPKGATTHFSFDNNGNLTATHDPAGNTTSFMYDPAGLLLSKTNVLGNKTSFAYDSAGDVTSVTDALSHTTTHTYDEVGHLVTTTDPNGHSNSRVYDVLDRITATIDPSYHQTRFEYDGVGNLSMVTDANDNVTHYAYDATNNLVNVVDTLGDVTSYTYDANNNRISFKNARGYATTYTYDALNRLKQTTDPLSFSTKYSYDGVGNTLSTTDGNGDTNQYTYDGLNRLLTESLADGSSVSYNYDSDGNRISMKDSRGTTTFSYDMLDRLLAITSPSAAVVQYAHDSLGDRTSLSYPDGRSVHYQYDAVSHLTQVTDWANATTHYTYDPAGNLTGFTYPNGVSSSYSYDAANRLLQLVNRSGSQILSSFSFVLDSLGNRIQATSPSGTTKYEYDPLGRLNYWISPSGQSTIYTYDPVGNREFMVNASGTTSYTYDPADRLVSTGGTSYGYDHNGNQIIKTTGMTTVQYGYDALNRLVSINGGGISSRYQYDGDGNRVTETVPTGTYQFINDTAASLPVVLNENGPDGNIDYTYGRQIISETSSAFQYFYQPDGLGSSTSMTDASGSLKASYSYDPWGNSLTPSDPLGTKNKYKFIGEESDPSSGLYFLRARYYDASIGRFDREDSFRGLPMRPMSLNRFIYAANNPVTFRDRSGFVIEGSGPSGDVSSDNPIEDLVSAVLDLGSISDTSELVESTVQGAGGYLRSRALIGLSADTIGAYTAIGAVAYNGLKIGTYIGSQKQTSLLFFDILNSRFGPARVQQWSTSPLWTRLSTTGDWLADWYFPGSR